MLRDCCQNWLGSRQLKNFGNHVRLLSNQFYELNPEILRTGTIQDEGIVSDLDRPSKMLYVGSDKIFAGIQQSQQQFVNNDREKAIKLQQKIWSMKKRMLQYDSVFCRQFQFIVPQVQESLGAAFAGPLQYFNVNFTHSPVAPHFDRAGFAGSNDFTGPGSSIATLRLQGPDVFVVLQEAPSVCKGRFPVIVYFTLKSLDLWALSGNSRFLTNHGVYPSRVPCLGTDCQPHSTK